MVKLEVRSKSESGFRRGGRHWGPTPVEVELEEEVANAVMRESQLFVRRLDGGPFPEAPPATPTTPLIAPATPVAPSGDSDENTPDGTLKKRR